jgi:hypothetical protein
VRRARALAALPLAALASLVACGSAGDVAPGTFTIEFPSTAAAIAAVKQTQGIQVFAFATDALGDSGVDEAGACESLVEDSRTSNMKATPVAKSMLIPPCDLLSSAGSLQVGYGNYAFLAVAQTSSGTDFLVGCAEQTISSTNTMVTIPLTLANSMDTVPSTTCTTLSQACPSGGKC